MARLVDLALGATLGVAVTTVLVAGAADAPTADPVKVSPQDYSVRLENERVRVLEWRLKPGGREPMHSHPDGVLIVLADAILKSTAPDGTATTRPAINGDVRWAPAVSHSIDNVGGTESRALLIELKRGGT